MRRATRCVKFRGESHTPLGLITYSSFAGSTSSFCIKNRHLSPWLAHRGMSVALIASRVLIQTSLGSHSEFGPRSRKKERKKEKKKKERKNISSYSRGAPAETASRLMDFQLWPRCGLRAVVAVFSFAWLFDRQPRRRNFRCLSCKHLEKTASSRDEEVSIVSSFELRIECKEPEEKRLCLGFLTRRASDSTLNNVRANVLLSMVNNRED